MVIEALDQASLRYELKMVTQERDYAHVLTCLRLHPSGIRTLHPARTVQSIYLDSPSSTAFQDNLAGISHRQKIRFRFYGEGIEKVRGQLECKVRQNNLGWKQTLVLPETLSLQNLPKRQFIHWLGQNIDEVWRLRLEGHLEPVQWVYYRRDYLTTADNRLRITLDQGLRAWDLRTRFDLSNRFDTPLPRVLVVEIKCLPEYLDEAQRLIRDLPLPVGRCSKFVLASAPDEGPMLQPRT